MVLALDISTAYVGWCLMDDSGSTLDAGAIELKKIGDMFSKAEEFKRSISGILSQNKPRRDRRKSASLSARVFKRKDNLHLVSLQRYGKLYRK